MNMKKLIDKYPFRYLVPIKWGEIDALGHLNNTVYFRLAEEARIKMFKTLGQNVTVEGGEGPVLAFIDFQFLSPVYYPDTLFVGSWISNIGTTSIQLIQNFYSEDQQKLVGKSKSVLVNIDYKKGTKLAIKDEVKKLLLESQKGFEVIT